MRQNTFLRNEVKLSSGGSRFCHRAFTAETRRTRSVHRGSGEALRNAQHFEGG